MPTTKPSTTNQAAGNSNESSLFTILGRISVDKRFKIPEEHRNSVDSPMFSEGTINLVIGEDDEGKPIEVSINRAGFNPGFTQKEVSLIVSILSQSKITFDPDEYKVIPIIHAQGQHKTCYSPQNAKLVNSVLFNHPALKAAYYKGFNRKDVDLSVPKEEK
jgi:hypothetical protein